MDSKEVEGELHRLMEAGNGAGLSKLLADAARLPIEAVPVKRVTEWKQFGNRVGEARRLNARLLALVLDESPADVGERYVRLEVDPWARHLPAIAVIRPQGGKWRLTDFVEASDSDLGPAIRRAFPSAKVHDKVPVGLPPSRLQREPESVPSEVGLEPLAANLAKLAEELYVPLAWLEDVVWLLRDRKGIVFFGPPGTGKTWIAQRLAEVIQPLPEFRRLVQLHPSYSYEDFFEGWRPADPGSGAGLVKVDGPLRSLVRAMTGEDVGVLVLDEMNRGNLARIFGELFFLLEYRDRSVRLMYSPEEEFRIPPELLVIGTMNTADRSVAVMDQALRRRFHFVPLFPGEPPISNVLRRFLADKNPELAWVADVLDEANARLPDRHMAIGPSHFLRADLSERVVELVWKHSILPSIEEQFYDQPGRLEAMQLEVLRNVVLAKREVDEKSTDDGGGANTDK